MRVFVSGDPQSEAVIPIINSYLGVGVNIVGSTCQGIIALVRVRD